MKPKPIETACVCIVTVMAGLVLIPFVSHFRAVGKVATMAQCGKNIYQFLVDPDMGEEQGSRQFFRSSTDYFRKQLASHQRPESSRLTLFDISAGMVPECKSASQFASSNNAWTVLATPVGAEEFPSVPILASRNLDVSGLQRHVVTEQPQMCALPFIPPGTGQPEWREWAVIVTSGGRIILSANAKKGVSFPSDMCAQGKNRELALRYLTPDESQNH